MSKWYLSRVVFERADTVFFFFFQFLHCPSPPPLFPLQSIAMFEDIEFTTERIVMWSVTFVVFVVVTYLTVADLTAPDNLDRGLRPVRTTKKSGKKED